LFNQQNDNETDFCESYKSQVLGTEEEEEEQSLFGTIVKLLTILMLVVIIMVVSLYGYHYFVNNQNLKKSDLPPVSMQVSEKETISDEDLVVTLEEPKVEKIIELSKAEEPKAEKEKVEEAKITTKEVDIDTMANDIKIEIAKNEIAEEQEIKEKEKLIQINNKEEMNLPKSEESLEVPTISTSAPEAQYLEELAELSNEIDKDRNK